MQGWISPFCPSLPLGAGTLSSLLQLLLQLLGAVTGPQLLLPPLQAKAVTLGCADH